MRLQPAPSPGLRVPSADQTHLTLHFLGEADPRRTAAALESIALPPVSLALECVGVFTSPTGAVTLCAGARASTELLRLRTAVAEALAAEGFRPEGRPYAPHITLGRFETGGSEAVVQEFLARSADFPRVLDPADGFSLYSSVFVDQAPVYRRERAYRLVRDD